MAGLRGYLRYIAIHRKPHTVLRRLAVQPRTVFGDAPCLKLSVDGYNALNLGWCPKMYADKRRANKKQRRHGIFEVWKLKIPFAVPVAVGRI